MVIYAPDGEKWACEACLKGHRVTSCSHKDRHLYHVNKKGRPVSQCQHCRGLRKSRHSHVKCVCAEYGIDKDHPVIFGKRCACGDGMPCTCGAKRDVDLDELPKAAARNLITHRRVHSHGSKPLMLNRRSDSVVPRPQLSAHHPPLHRMNNAAHDYGTPYQMNRFTTSTPNVSSLGHPASEDNLQIASAMQQTTPPPIVTTHDSTANVPTSAPTSAWTPGHNHSQSYSSQASPIDGYQPAMSGAGLLQPGTDTSFMNNALSPGNPARYSMNDFSGFQWQGFGSSDMYSNPTYAASADQLGTSNWSDWSMETPQFSQGNTAVQTPLNRLSVASVDQPGLTHSPSNTVSEAGSSVHPSDTSHSNFGTQPAPTINPSFTSKDYFGLDPVSENIMGDTPSDSFAYPSERTVNMGDIFGAGPGPAECLVKPEPENMSPMNNQSFATPDQVTSGNGPSLVVPQFNTELGTTSSYIQYSGIAPAGQQQPQRFYDQMSGEEFSWNM